MSPILCQPGALGVVAFDRPYILLAIALAAVPILLALLARRRGRSLGWPGLAAQSIAIALVATAIAGPRIPLGKQAQLPYAVFRDVSGSVRTQSELPVTLPPGLAGRDYFFAGDIATSRGQVSDINHTRLAGVLQLAGAEADKLGGAILVTDGQWQDDWSPAAAALASSPVPLLIVPLDSPPADARITGLQARRLADGKAEVRLAVEANSPLRRRLTLERVSPPQVLLARDLTLLPNSPVSFTLADASTGLANYRASLSPHDDVPENDQAGQLLPPSSRQVLVLAAEPAAIAGLVGQPFAVATSVPVDAPTSEEGYLASSAVVLVDPRGDLLAPAASMAIARYVRNGGGLVLLGAGPHSGPADRDDPLNQVAALIANPYQRQPLHVVVVIDSSGSMAAQASAGQSKFQLASQAVLSLAKHMTAGDSLAVISYSNVAHFIYDSNGAAPDFRALDDALRAVVPEGQTKALPALELATTSRPAGNRQGLILLVSDLLTEPYDAADAQVVKQVQAVQQSLKDGKWKLSIVAAKSPQDTPEVQTALGELARRAGAQMVQKEGLAGLAEVFRQFLQQARGDAIARGKFDVTFAPDVLGLARPALGVVDQYILSAGQDASAVLATIGGDPVLAIRQVGLGRSASLALPLDSGANQGIRAAGLRDLLEATITWSARPADDPRFSCQTSERAGRLTIRVQAAEAGTPMNDLELRARMQAGESSPVAQVRLVQTGPGVYETSLPAPTEPGFLAIQRGQQIVCEQPVLAGGSQEYSAIGANWDNLRKLAQITGGRIVRPAELEDLTGQLRRETLTPVWPYLLGLAMLLMLADWCGSRVLRRA